MLNKEKPVTVTIDSDKCTKCGKCIKACSAEYLIFDENEIKGDKNSLIGCIQCGHCMMTCPNDAIGIEGEGISKNDIVEINPSEITFEKLHSFFLKRRSIRKFKEEEKEVSKESIEKIIKAASTAPIGIPLSEVKVLVVNGKEKVQEFAEDIVDSFKSFLKMFRLIKLFKPFMKKQKYQVFDEFIIPLLKETIDARKNGKDILFYDAPCVVIFYNSEITDKEDSIIAATTATIAAETLGLGTCIIGSIPSVINSNKKLKTKYGILQDEIATMAFILGIPKKTFTKGINRSFKEVKFY